MIWKAASPKNIPSTPHHVWLINGRAENVYKESINIRVNKQIPKQAAVPTSETYTQNKEPFEDWKLMMKALIE